VPVLYGVRPGPPGLGPGIPMGFPPDGLAGCANTGAQNPSAAAIATPVNRCFISLILSVGIPDTITGNFRAIILRD